MKLSEIISDNEDFFSGRKRYVTIASYLLYIVEKIKDQYYLAGKLPSQIEIDELKEFLDLFNLKIKIASKNRSSLSAERAKTIMQKIDSIISEISSVLENKNV